MTLNSSKWNSSLIEIDGHRPGFLEYNSTMDQSADVRRPREKLSGTIQNLSRKSGASGSSHRVEADPAVYARILIRHRSINLYIKASKNGLKSAIWSTIINRKTRITE